MRYRTLALLGIVAVVVMMIGIWPGSQPAVGQTQTTASDSGTLPRTPWGDPDLQGIWGLGYVFTPLERPEELAGKEVLTEVARYRSS